MQYPREFVDKVKKEFSEDKKLITAVKKGQDISSLIYAAVKKSPELRQKYLALSREWCNLSVVIEWSARVMLNHE